MRVLFDGYWWVSGPFSNRTVMREFVVAWRSAFPDDELHVLVPKTLPDAADRPSGVTFHRTRLPLQAVINAVALPALARRTGASLMVAHNFSPLTGRSAVFVHDLMFVDHPEWFTAAENAYFRAMVWTARRAGHLFSSSASERERIRRITDHNSVTSIGLGMNAALLEATPQRPAQLPGSAMRFHLAVGRLNVRKNLAATVEALLDADALNPETPLVVVGESSGRVPDENAALKAAVTDHKVIFLGAVPDAELRWLYEHCLDFVFMSLDEGFGLPCLESQVFTAPAAVSDIPPFREILGEDADYADPHDLRAIAAAVRRASERRPDRKAALNPAPLERYNWTACVRAIRETVVGVASSRTGGERE